MYNNKSNIKIYDTLPQGYKPLIGANCCPRGTYWASNGQSRFVQDIDGHYHKNPNFVQILVRK